MKGKVGKIGAKLKLNGVDWSEFTCLFTNDTVLLAESERELQRVVDQFHSVCTTRKLRVNSGKSKVMVFKRIEVEVVNFENPCRVSVPIAERCKIVLGGERMGVVKEFKHLGTVLNKVGEMEGEARQSCERRECHRFSSKGYEREECVHGSTERLKE